MPSPLLVIDGDSFAHRAYHAVPKTIRRNGKIPAGAIVGFANILLRLYEQEQPRAVLVGWDTLNAPTYRNELFPSYQSGREFDEDLLEQLERLPEIGSGLAARIIEHRERYGAFRRVEHLIIVRGISQRRFEALRPYVTL